MLFTFVLINGYQGAKVVRRSPTIVIPK